MLTKEEIFALPALTLAIIGDGVHTLHVRKTLVCAEKKLRNLTDEVRKRVNARAQAAKAEVILPLLNEAEAQIFNRGKNAKVNQIPKICTPLEYHLATAFEAVLGYLYLINDPRLDALLVQ
ncbi:MAG: ribonuclease III [Christensenellaceae bacterium]|jgi:ribonuclease-3 family protein|nr:ribonuclease III [Christensenellaceae bacterium]